MTRPKLRLVHGYRPHECIVLGIVPGRQSGWSIFVCGKLINSGIAKSLRDRCLVLERVRALRHEMEIPVIVVAEESFHGGTSWEEISGRFESWGRWDEHLQLSGFSDVVRVLVHIWRKDAFGRSPRRMERETSHELAKARVRSVYSTRVSGDEAEGILVGEWGCRSLEVGRFLAA